MINITTHNYWKYLAWMVFCLWFLLMLYLFVKTANAGIENIVCSEVATPHTTTPSTQLLTIPDSYQQFTQFVVQKSIDDSKAINNLTNSIYYLTLLIGVFALFAPFLIFFLNNKQEKALEKKTESLQKEISGMKVVVIKEVQNEFQDRLMEDIKHKIDKRVGNYGKLAVQRMESQTDEHEERLRYVVEILADLLAKNKHTEVTMDNVLELMTEQQETHLALMQLISPDEKETFTALDFFQECGDLPKSFLFLLRFLDKQNRLPGDSRDKADEIATQKCKEPLVPPAK